MADLLRSGATLTEYSCPVCSSPLFRLKGDELWCAKCQKKVVVVKEGEQVTELTSLAALGEVESTLLGKIQEINKMIREEGDIEHLQRLSNVLSTLLENLEKIKKIEKQAP